MTSTPIADLLVHGDVVVRMCEVFRATVFSNGDLWLGQTQARDVRSASKTASMRAADVTSAIALAMGYATPRAFLDNHSIVGVAEAVTEAATALGGKRKRAGVVRSAYCRRLTVGPVGKCAVAECPASVCAPTAMALCAPCAARLGGVFHAQTRSFVAKPHTRKTRVLVEVTGAELELLLATSPRAPTLPMFVEPPGPYHLPDDVAAHILYVARLCKQRAHATAPTKTSGANHHAIDALAKGVIETPVGALDAAAFRPGLAAVYARLRLLA